VQFTYNTFYYVKFNVMYFLMYNIDLYIFHMHLLQNTELKMEPPMAKTAHPTVLTANDLIEGHSVFLTPEGWAPAIGKAMVAVSTEQGEELSALGQRFLIENQIVGPYLVEVSMESGQPVPLSRREQIRASGAPTIPVGIAA
jgi:hypothetical protein